MFTSEQHKEAAAKVKTRDRSTTRYKKKENPYAAQPFQNIKNQKGCWDGSDKEVQPSTDFEENEYSEDPIESYRSFMNQLDLDDEMMASAHASE